jgi:hypothetical protein
MAASRFHRDRPPQQKVRALRGERTTWHGRAAWLLENELVQLTHLTGGGNIVDFHFKCENTINPFWVPRWRSMEPFEFEAAQHRKVYGPPEVGKLLCGIAGHTLCLDLFGAPSPEEAGLGRVLHGEAGVSRWKTSLEKSPTDVKLIASVRLPRTGLSFERRMRLTSGESIVYVRETVKNERQSDHFFQWQQHVTLGAPFLSPADCVVNLPGARGLTHPAGYEGHELLKSNRKFTWPNAPHFHHGSVDLRRPLTTPGRGFVAGVQIAPDRSHAFVCALNTRLALVIGYCFRREDFPWITLWEENRTRSYSPWKGREQTRGLEFGASPLPLTHSENFRLGDLFGTPTLAHLPAESARSASYAFFLAHVPRETRAIANVAVRNRTLDLIGVSGKLLCSLPAGAIKEHLA